MAYIKIWNEIRQHILRFKYPYRYTSHVNDYTCEFTINDPVDEYRVVKFGEEELFLSHVLNHLDKNDIFFDIGPSIGLYSIYAAKRVAQVVSFEPDNEIHCTFIKETDKSEITCDELW